MRGTPPLQILMMSTTASQISTKQDKLTFDSEPTEGSSNPVTSGGVYNAINSGGSRGGQSCAVSSFNLTHTGVHTQLESAGVVSRGKTISNRTDTTTAYYPGFFKDYIFAGEGMLVIANSLLSTISVGQIHSTVQYAYNYFKDYASESDISGIYQYEITEISPLAGFDPKKSYKMHLYYYIYDTVNSGIHYARWIDLGEWINVIYDGSTYTCESVGITHSFYVQGTPKMYLVCAEIAY